ncbi:hypothetical protein IWZ00DRAFT_367186 [Phyllosticta capitalensis]
MLTRQLLRSACAAPRCSQGTSTPPPHRPTLLPASTARHSPLSPLVIRYAQPSSPLNRIFATTSRTRKDETKTSAGIGQAEQKAAGVEGVKAETVEKAKPATPASAAKNDPLLAEKTVSNKEQRTADWAIMKEMSRYLWPKVRACRNKALVWEVDTLQGFPQHENTGRSVCGPPGWRKGEFHVRSRLVYSRAYRHFRFSMCKFLFTSRTLWTL